MSSTNVRVTQIVVTIPTSNTDYRSVVNRETDRHLVKLDTKLNITCNTSPYIVRSTSEVNTDTSVEVPLTYLWSPVPVEAIPLVESSKICTSTTEETETSLSILI